MRRPMPSLVLPHTYLEHRHWSSHRSGFLFGSHPLFFRWFPVSSLLSTLCRGVVAELNIGPSLSITRDWLYQPTRQSSLLI